MLLFILLHLIVASAPQSGAYRLIDEEAETQEYKRLVQSHAAGAWPSWDMNPGQVALHPWLFLLSPLCAGGACQNGDSCGWDQLDAVHPFKGHFRDDRAQHRSEAFYGVRREAGEETAVLICSESCTQLRDVSRSKMPSILRYSISLHTTVKGHTQRTLIGDSLKNTPRHQGPAWARWRMIERSVQHAESGGKKPCVPQLVALGAGRAKMSPLKAGACACWWPNSCYQHGPGNPQAGNLMYSGLSMVIPRPNPESPGRTGVSLG